MAYRYHNTSFTTTEDGFAVVTCSCGWRVAVPCGDNDQAAQICGLEHKVEALEAILAEVINRAEPLLG